ncbi:MAG: hypothetical protein WC446_00725 [Candidatus Paceibacterota bacterium]|jgi:hypothetical protein
MIKKITLLSLSILFLGTSSASASFWDDIKGMFNQEPSGYECIIMVDNNKISDPECLEYIQRGHKCQITGKYNGGVPNFCLTTCLERSNIPAKCAKVDVQVSSFSGEQKGLPQINIDNIIENINIPEIKIPEIVIPKIEIPFLNQENEEEEEYKCEIDEKWNGKECIVDKVLLPNEYEVMYTSKGEKIIKFVDSYGQEKYTRDGKNYYDTYGRAATNNILTSTIEKAKELPDKIWDFFFKTKLVDKDKELQREVGREVFRTLQDDKIEKIEEKYADIVGDIASSFLPEQAKDLVSVPADSIKKFAKEAKETEFSEGVMIYIKEREAGSTRNQLYQNTPEELIYGGIGGGVAAGLNVEYPKALLFSKYEEAYQRYVIAKELGRND